MKIVRLSFLNLRQLRESKGFIHESMDYLRFFRVSRALIFRGGGVALESTSMYYQEKQWQKACIVRHRVVFLKPFETP